MSPLEKSAIYKKGERVTLICLFGNLVLSILKLLAGFMGNSAAMIADGFHSVSDVFATTAVYIGISIAKKPCDDNHPYGHGKVEPLISVFVAFTLFYAGFSIGKSTIVSIIDADFVTPSLIALIVAIVSIITKEIMFRVTMKVGKELNSQSIQANAWDHRSDAYSSIGTMFGIGGAMLGGALNIPILGYLDPIAGFIVACLILKISVEIFLKAIHSLMDGNVESEVINNIYTKAGQIYCAENIKSIKARYSGPELLIDMIIQVSNNLTVEQGHQIADQISDALKVDVPHVTEVFIHVNPVEDRIADTREEYNQKTEQSLMNHKDLWQEENKHEPI